MSEKHVVVDGAVCKCQFGVAPDKIKVLSHKKEYANDKAGASKLIATTKEIGGSTLTANTFGTCSKMGSPPPPCKPVITEWQDYYDEVVLTNGGKILLETSKAVCAVAGTACIEVIHHGQVAEPSVQNFSNANENIQGQLNPCVSMNQLSEEDSGSRGIVFSQM